ncbi:MAG: nucleotide exchange factor GrpE, partial [Candidatus Micrarchaeota archaeon]|nr:nucleotide exchange factor GrpE [Candidatus Micrarchaeota archaeon]
MTFTADEKKQEKAESNDGAVQAEEALELKDRLLRLAAEFDNYKKRVAKDAEAGKTIGKVDIVRKLLPTLDEFELAINSMNSANDGSAKGIEMVYSNLIDALKSEGLRTIETKGKADPYRHEVMLAKESEKDEGTILEV